MYCQFKAWCFIIDYKVDKMSRCDKYSDEEICADRLSDYSYDSDSESQDTEESDDDDIIPRSRVFIRRRISSSSFLLYNHTVYI